MKKEMEILTEIGQANAIEVRNATVRFNIASEKIDNLKEYMVKAVKRELMFKEFLALDDVSLAIPKGEAWGLVGPNGAGKSTLLKLICGILTPYKGSVQHRGSIAPLIELGAGFDPNLTAEENIYLNGAILGHSKEFMRNHYAEIVDFAELHKFMEMPIKNYSSGMRARLGFAIATIVRPDILIVDEVLSVGDAAFQKKCERRMNDMLGAGVTLLFVSHAVNAVRNLCDHALWLDHGKAQLSGPVDQVCTAYETSLKKRAVIPVKKTEGTPARKTTPYDYLIVGSGLSGAVFGYEMACRGKKVLVLEKRNHTGGNLYCEDVEGIQVHKYGPHIFHTDDKALWDYMNRFEPFNQFINAPLANYKGEIYNLPFNMNTFNRMWGTVTPQQAREKIQGQQSAFCGEPQNLEQQAIQLVGQEIYEKLIKGYTEKQWGKPCDSLPPDIIKRLPVRYTYDNNYFNHAYQGVPQGGYTPIIQQMLEGCEVRLNVDYLADKAQWDAMAGRVIYTGPLDAYFGCSLGHLAYRSLRFSDQLLAEENHQGVAVMNYTDRETPYTRSIEHKHFTFGKQPVTVVTHEFPEPWEPGKEAYYPINDAANEALASRYRKLTQQEGKTVFLGRLGTYQYLDMDKALKIALRAVQEETASADFS